MCRLINAAKLAEVNTNSITVYHGTKDVNFVPDYAYANSNNDYGCGLYTTPNLGLAREWAMSGYTSGLQGYVYEYNVDTNGLNILDLSKIDSISWITLLMTNRPPELKYDLVRKNVEKLKYKYNVDIEGYDIIKGYRADDSYYGYARAFVSGQLSKEALDNVLILGKLELQYCFKSKESFDRLEFVKRHDTTDKDRINFIKRDAEARLKYKEILRNDIGSTSVYNYI